jgi:hypothetical protein
MKRAGFCAALTLAGVMLAGLTLTACGGSSKGTSSSVTHSTASNAQTTVSTVTSSKTTTRKVGPSVHGASASQREQLRHELERLRAHTHEPSKSATVKPRPAAPRVQLPPKLAGALQKFAACMRENGVTNFPEPHGATFDTSHLNTSSPQFKAAETKCNAVLQGAF